MGTKLLPDSADSAEHGPGSAADTPGYSGSAQAALAVAHRGAPMKKGRSEAAFRGLRSDYCTAAFLPSLYVYRVLAAFFSSPFGSNTMLAVTPL